MALKEEKQKQVDALVEESKEKEKALEGYKPTSPNYEKLREEIIMLRAQLRMQKEYTESLWNERNIEAYVDFQKDISDAVKQYARANGIDLVFKTPDSEIGGPDLAQKLVRLSQQELVYFSETVDITDGVLAILNAR